MSRLFTIAGTEIAIPDGYLPMRPMPDDPPGAQPLGIETPLSTCFLMAFPIPVEQAMPYGTPNDVVAGIHEALADDQGLVEVEAGNSAKGRRFIYSVIKTAAQPSGTQYALTLNLDTGKIATCIQGFFDEAGTTGARDSAVFAMTGATNDEWRRDPYDSSITKGNLMNLSELPKYDSAFPDHPLSRLRNFVSLFVKEN